MAKLAHAQDLGSCGEILAGSSPVARTKVRESLIKSGFFPFLSTFFAPQMADTQTYVMLP